MGKPIRNVTIVGGGTSGWVAACFLNRVCRAQDPNQQLNITLIESPNVPIIGVGEATVPGMVLMLRQLDISEKEFFRRTNAAFKLGGRFVNWDHGPNGEPLEFMNILNAPRTIDGRTAGEFFINKHPARNTGNAGLEYGRACSSAVELARFNRAPRPIGGQDYSGAIGYSYHFDATKFAELLREVAISRGVNHISDDVDAVHKDERGFISSLTLRERGEHPIELVIDCTGFRGVIVQQALGEPFEPYSDYLLNDRAAVMQIPHADPTQITPATTATGLKSGWNFRVPLYNRIGTGYIYSSNFISDDEAIDELLQLYGEQAKDATPRIIPIRTGRLRNSWVKNCVSLGLSGGFIEPLEATAIYMSEMSVRWLYHYFPSTDFEPALQNRYNREVNKLFDEVRDFIQLHFHLNNRTDTPYWIAAREEVKLSDQLQEYLDVWKHAMPQDMDLNSTHLFSMHTYAMVLIGKGFYQNRDLNKVAYLNDAPWNHYLKGVRELTQKHVRDTPSHYEFLRKIHESPPGPLTLKPQAQQAPLPPQPVASSSFALPGIPITPRVRYRR